MFGILFVHSSWALWSFAAFSSSGDGFSPAPGDHFSLILRQDERLRGALDLYHEGQDYFRDGKFEEACDAVMTGIFMGRKTVQSMQEEGESSSSDDNEGTVVASLALDWLVASYLLCAEGHMELGDWQTARSDAWAACMYSQNTNLSALQKMLRVCEHTEDLFGQLSTLKSIEGVLAQNQLNNNGGDTMAKEFTAASIHERIETVEAQLQKKFSN